MKIFYITLIVSILLAKTSDAQNCGNVIQNSSFEERRNGFGSNPDRPDAEAQVRYCADWDDRRNQVNVSGEPIQYHSPDWLRNVVPDGSNHIELVEWYPTSSTATMFDKFRFPAATGSHYVSMRSGELITQKLSGSNKLDGGDRYVISLRLRQFQGVTFQADNAQNGFSADIPFFNFIDSTWHNPLSNSDHGWDTTQSSATLYAYVSRRKPRYDDTQSWDATKDPNHNNQDIIEVLKLHLDPPEDPTQVWRNIQAEFIAPPQTYDWITVELISNPIGYRVAIDDVILSKSCLDQCSRTSGIVSPITSNSVVSGVSFIHIDGLNNTTDVEIQVYNELLQLIYFEAYSCSNGFPTGLDYYGQSGFNGNGYLSPGQYYYKLLHYNDCGFTCETDFVPFNVIDQYPTALRDTLKCNQPVILPKPCCAEEPNIYIDYELIQGEGLLDYQAIYGVTTSSQPPEVANQVILKEDAEVLFQAGEEINLNAGFTALKGVAFCAKIKPCEGSPYNVVDASIRNKSNFNDEVEKPSSKPIISTNTAEYIDDAMLSIYPNPTAGKISIESGLSITKVEIYDVYGKQLFSKSYSNKLITLDFGLYPQGMYFLQLENEKRQAEVVKILRH